VIRLEVMMQVCAQYDAQLRHCDNTQGRDHVTRATDSLKSSGSHCSLRGSEVPVVAMFTSCNSGTGVLH
jgi:hypothetical protein